MMHYRLSLFIYFSLVALMVVVLIASFLYAHYSTQLTVIPRYTARRVIGDSVYELFEENGTEGVESASAINDAIVQYINEQLMKAETLKGIPLKNEYFLKNYCMFDRENIYQVGMGVEQPKQAIVRHKDLSEELTSVIASGVSALNNGSKGTEADRTYRFTEADFLYGLQRIEMGIGIHYELVYKPHSSKVVAEKSKLFRSTLFRAFAPLRSIQTSSSNEAEIIYFIVPLQGRLDAFKIFIKTFNDFAVPDKSVHLTVVYYGSEGLTEVEQALQSLETSASFNNYKLLKIVNESFARGRALHHGINSIEASDPLMFFCDVDMAFTREFFNECRAHSTAGLSVFYPIVFSLFNPEMVFEKSNPSLRSQQQHTKKHGFWRSFGYGMTCQHLSDYRNIGGFDLNITGWGSEDVKLVRKFSQSDIIVVRTPVDSLFHRWHEKFCDKSLPAEQYSSCLSSRALTEGSSRDVALKYFELKERLKFSQNG